MLYLERRTVLRGSNNNPVIPSKDGAWSPKTRWGARTIPASKMSARAWEAVKSCFTTYEALNVHRVTVYRIVNRVASRSKLTAKVYPHSLRATAATRVAYRIKNPQVLCDIFGWGQLASLNIMSGERVAWW